MPFRFFAAIKAGPKTKISNEVIWTNDVEDTAVTLFDHPIWPYVVRYAHVVPGRDNLDFLQMPDQIRSLAVEVVCNCVACGRLIRPMRARTKSDRSRVGGTETERRLFYAATCPSEIDPGCARTKAAMDHKNEVRRVFGLPLRVGNEAVDVPEQH